MISTMGSHVVADEAPVANSVLLSPQAKIKKIRELLGSNFTHAGQLFIPDYHMHQLSDNDQLLSSAKELFRWIGIKPGHLQVRYAAIQEPGRYIKNDSEEVIEIHSALANSPFEALSVLTHTVLHAVFARRNFSYATDGENETLINLAAIESGFGLAIINGFYPPQKKIFSIIRPVASRQLTEQFYPDRLQIFEAFYAFLSARRFHHDTYGQYVAPWAKRQLSQNIQDAMTRPASSPVFITNEIRRLRKETLCMAGISLASVVIMAGGIAVLFN